MSSYFIWYLSISGLIYNSSDCWSLSLNSSITNKTTMTTLKSTYFHRWMHTWKWAFWIERPIFGLVGQMILVHLKNPSLTMSVVTCNLPLFFFVCYLNSIGCNLQYHFFVMCNYLQSGSTARVNWLVCQIRTTIKWQSVIVGPKNIPL